MSAVFLDYTVTAWKIKFGPFGWAWNWLSVFFLWSLLWLYIGSSFGRRRGSVKCLPYTACWNTKLRAALESLEVSWQVCYEFLLAAVLTVKLDMSCWLGVKYGHTGKRAYKVYRHAGIQGTQVYGHPGHTGSDRMLWDIQQWLGVKWEKGECRGKYWLNPPIDCKTARSFA